MRDRPRPGRVLMAAGLASTVLVGAGCASGDPGRHQALAATGLRGRRLGSGAPSTSTTASSTTASSTTLSTATLSTATPSLLPPPGAGAQGQTSAEPSTATPVFRAEMDALWQAVVSGDAQSAQAAFFPEPAYSQLKALSDDGTDWTDRLWAHFVLDVGAAHRLLGAQPARLVTVLAPDTAAWIPPGACYNRLGYWHLPGARVVYRQGGATRSFGIASLISWRGYWYVVHLGSVLPPAGTGVVDAPAAGIGVFTPTGGC